MGLIMKASTLMTDRRLHSLVLWLPPVIVVAGLVLGLMTPLAFTAIGLWSLAGFLAYWLLVYEWRRTRRFLASQRMISQGIVGLRLAIVIAIVSAALLASGLSVICLLVYLPPTICHGGVSCSSQTLAPWPFDSLTLSQLADLWLFLIAVGLVALTVSSRLIARALRRIVNPRVGVLTPDSPAHSV